MEGGQPACAVEGAQPMHHTLRGGGATNLVDRLESVEGGCERAGEHASDRTGDEDRGGGGVRVRVEGEGGRRGARVEGEVRIEAPASRMVVRGGGGRRGERGDLLSQLMRQLGGAGEEGAEARRGEWRINDVALLGAKVGDGEGAASAWSGHL